MIDLQLIREQPDLVREKSKQKNVEVDIDRLLQLDEQRRGLQSQIDNLRQERNELSAQFKSSKPSSEQIQKGKELKEQIAKLEEELTAIQPEFQALYEKVPNLPTDDTPVGSSEGENQVVKTVGEPRQFDFEPKDHEALGVALGVIDKARAAKVAGARFVYLKGGLVKMQFALVQWALDVLGDEATIAQIAQNAGLHDISTKPFLPVLPPAMERIETMQRMARFEPADQRYVFKEDGMVFNGSAEHTLGPMYMDETLPAEDLPIRLLGYATSFRREAGTYGKDMGGIIRLHQFDKLEMESFSTPEQGMGEHLLMIAIQEYFMQQLNLPYQVLLKCTADIGDPNARGVDIESWFPAQGKYRETHSADFMTDYQARRLQTFAKTQDGRRFLVHTNDATAIVMSRIPAAIMENYQQADGSVAVPDVLKPYMNGRTTI